MKRFSDRHQLSTLSELNVTPLLDLAFVLLIIFMITTPLMENSSDLVLPTSKAAEGAVDPAEVETLSLDKEMQVSLNGQTMGVENVEAALRGQMQTRPIKAVTLRAHRELSVQQLMELMEAVKRAGITKIGMMSTE